MRWGAALRVEVVRDAPARRRPAVRWARAMRLLARDRAAVRVLDVSGQVLSARVLAVGADYVELLGEWGRVLVPTSAIACVTSRQP